MIRDLLLKNRSYRRFDASQPIDYSVLKSLVELATLCPSARNAQPLKYIIVNSSEQCDKVFNTLAWAGYLTHWPGPDPAERPTAYLIQCIDTDIANHCFCDDGIQAQSILLGAVEKGLGGCIIKAINEPKLRAELAIPDSLKVNQVIALGVPVENIILEPMVNGEYKYWRDEQGGHHVPKRSVDEIIIEIK